MWILPANMLWAALVKTGVDLILTNVENTCLKAFLKRSLNYDPAVNFFDEVRLPATFTLREKR